MNETFEDFIRNNPDVLLSDAFEKFKSLNPEITNKKQLRDLFFKAVDSFLLGEPK